MVDWFLVGSRICGLLVRCPKSPLPLKRLLTKCRLCAVFGICSYTSTGNEYQSDLSTTWGSFAYLIGSMLQWYEAVNKRSVEDLFDGTAELDASRLQPLGHTDTERTQADRESAPPATAQKQCCVSNGSNRSDPAGGANAIAKRSGKDRAAA